MWVEKRKDTKPKIFLVLKIVGFSLAVAGVVLLILGIATPDPSSSNSLFAGTAQKMGVIFGGAACLIISISLIFAGFTPSIKRIQVKTTKYIVSDNKEDLTDIATDAADIAEPALSKLKKQQNKRNFAKNAASRSMRMQNSASTVERSNKGQL